MAEWGTGLIPAHEAAADAEEAQYAKLVGYIMEAKDRGALRLELWGEWDEWRPCANCPKHMTPDLMLGVITRLARHGYKVTTHRSWFFRRYTVISWE